MNEMALQISEVISDETVCKVINLYNATHSEKVVIYLNSRGGNYDAIEILIDLINANSKRTTLVAYGIIASCAFELFFSVKCNKRIVGGCIGMYHQSKIDVTINESIRVCAEDKARLGYMSNYMKQRTIDVCKLVGMSDTEIAKITLGKDMWFGVDRMNEFANKLKTKK